MDGILPLWKPKGLTSHDCVMKIRKLYHTKKVGHTGTLDPEVEGVLPICIGQATKIVPFLTDTRKTYEAEIALGKSTDTEDSYGKTLELKEPVFLPEQETIEEVLTSFQGEITQVPPMYSAVKVKGKKLYEYAREGIEVDRPSRKVTVHQLELLSIKKDKSDGLQRFSIRVECSKGTYIRTLAVDIGKALGYPAHMSDLVRTRTGDFGKEDCITFEGIEQESYQEGRLGLLSPMKKGIKHLGIFQVSEEEAKKVKVGQKLPLPSSLPETNPFRVECNEQLLAIYQIHPSKENEIKPVKVFQNESR